MHGKMGGVAQEGDGNAGLKGRADLEGNQEDDQMCGTALGDEEEDNQTSGVTLEDDLEAGDVGRTPWVVDQMA